MAREEEPLSARTSDRAGPGPARSGSVDPDAGQQSPQELGFGSGMTCWRRLRDWQQAGVFDQVHHELLAHLNAAALIDWSRVIVDASHVPAKKGARAPGRARSTVASPARNTM